MVFGFGVWCLGLVFGFVFELDLFIISYVSIENPLLVSSHVHFYVHVRLFYP